MSCVLFMLWCSMTYRQYQVGSKPAKIGRSTLCSEIGGAGTCMAVDWLAGDTGTTNYRGSRVVFRVGEDEVLVPGYMAPDHLQALNHGRVYVQPVPTEDREGIAGVLGRFYKLPLKFWDGL